MNILTTIKDLLALGSEVKGLVMLVIQSVKQADPDKAAQYARRAALKQAFDIAQKAKRNEPVK